MPRYSLVSLLLLIAAISMFCGLLLVQASNWSLKDDIQSLEGELETVENRLQSEREKKQQSFRDRKTEESRQAILFVLSLSGDSKALSVINSFDREAIDFRSYSTNLPDFSVYHFYEHQELPKKSRAVGKSIWILVETKSLRIVDMLIPPTNARSYLLWPDELEIENNNIHKRYKICEDGFKFDRQYNP